MKHDFESCGEHLRNLITPYCTLLEFFKNLKRYKEEGNEGLLVASRIADRVGITRSVIVNALRKFESAGVIESRSLGMKGTHIKILNDKLIPELEKVRSNY